MTGLNRDTGGTSQRRGVHGDPWRRTWPHGGHFTAHDTPLGDLIAGRIGQAEYRRRMAELERRAADSLDVEPAPIRRRAPEAERSGAGCVWVLMVLALALTFALGVLVGSSIAAPRSVPDPTAAHPGASGSDVASAAAAPARVLGGASGPGPTEAPPAAPPSWPVATGRQREPSGGASPTETRTQALGDMVAASRRISGLATWYCLSGSSVCTRGYGQDDLVAAIDTDLGFAKGDRITVRYRDAEVTVTVVDVCGCPGDRLIDLTSGAFARLASLDLGVIPVTIEAAGPALTLPPTEAAP